MSLKIVCVSDTHGRLIGADIPKGDVLVLAGDILPNKTRDWRVDMHLQEMPLQSLDEYLGTLGFRKIYFVAGNHDWLAERNDKALRVLKHMTYLKDSGDVFEGVKFYGSPWQPWFYDWAFNFPEEDPWNGYPAAKATWAKIPDDANVVITHGPPKDILDRCPDGARVGCPILRDRLAQLKNLKLSVFGHIHDSYGMMTVNGVPYVNASLCNEDYSPVNKIQTIEINIEVKQANSDSAGTVGSQ